MKNQQEQKNLNKLDDNIFDNEKIMLEYNSLYLNNSICYLNSSLNLMLKENINSLKQNEIIIEKKNNTLTIESFKNILSDEKLLGPKEKKLNNDTHLFKFTHVNPDNPELKSTEDSSPNIKITKNNKNKFEIRYYNNRGKKPKENDKNKKYLNKKHNRADFDNLQTKIQVHCINFLINFVNDIVHTVFNSNENSFKNINYKAKKRINHSYITVNKTLYSL